MKVSELTGALLDFWVARAEGLEPYIRPSGHGPVYCWVRRDGEDVAHVFMPNLSLSDAGPIIEREQIALGKNGALGTLHAYEAGEDTAIQYGPTPLIAAMRAYVASKFGDELPDEMNQCDGCRVRAPLTDQGNHAMPDGGFMGCTAHLYGSKP